MALSIACTPPTREAFVSSLATTPRVFKKPRAHSFGGFPVAPVSAEADPSSSDHRRSSGKIPPSLQLSDSGKEASKRRNQSRPRLLSVHERDRPSLAVLALDLEDGSRLWTFSTNLTCEEIMPIKADPGSGGGGMSSNGAGGVFKKSRSPPTVIFNLTSSASDTRTYDRTASASTSTTIVTINASSPPNSARSVAFISAASAQLTSKKRSAPLARNRPRMLSLRNFDRPDLNALLSGDEDCSILPVGSAA